MKTKKTVIVTGGNKGIGASISTVFYGNGYHVVIGSRSDNGLAGKLGARAMFVETDVCKPGDLRRLVDKATGWTERLDVMVNNAGFSAWRPVEDIDEPFWNRMIDTNLKGTLFGCREAAAKLESGGCIINISSLAGKRGSANNSAYCASKFGVNGITQSLAKEIGPRGIRVNAVCPVYVRTEGVLEALSEANSPASGQTVDEYLHGFAKSNSALGKLPTGEEIGQACLFLASSAASAITGQCINVDCGVLPQ